MRPDISDFRLCWEAFHPSNMSGGAFIAALVGLVWLVAAALLTDG
jgi:hypothetical protein